MRTFRPSCHRLLATLFQGPSRHRNAEQQAARRILVVRAILDDFGTGSDLPDFLFAEVSLDCAPEGVPAEFKLSRRQLLPDLGRGFHSAAPSTSAISSGVRA